MPAPVTVKIAFWILLIGIALDLIGGILSLVSGIGLSISGTSVDVNGTAAERYTLLRTKKKAKEDYVREVTVFRRGGRVYCFAVTFGADDPTHRDAARASVASVTWTGG